MDAVSCRGGGVNGGDKAHEVIQSDTELSNADGNSINPHY